VFGPQVCYWIASLVGWPQNWVCWPWDSVCVRQGRERLQCMTNREKGKKQHISGIDYSISLSNDRYFIKLTNCTDFMGRNLQFPLLRWKGGCRNRAIHRVFRDVSWV